jgi:curved DNA-binding protein CbpA
MGQLLELDTSNYYALLGIDAEVADDTIVQKAYRRIAMIAHPDRNPEHIDKATELFKLLTLAYDALKTADNRALYSQSIQQKTPFSSRKTNSSRKAGSTSPEPDRTTVLIREREAELAKYEAQYRKSEAQADYLQKVKQDEIKQRIAQIADLMQKKEAALTDAVQQHVKWFTLDNQLRSKLESGSFTDSADKRAIIQKIKDSTASANLWSDTATKLTGAVSGLKIELHSITTEQNAYIASQNTDKLLRQQEYNSRVARKQAEIQELKSQAEQQSNSRSYSRPRNG